MKTNLEKLSVDSKSPFFTERTNRLLGLAASVLVLLYGAVLLLRPEQFFADDSFFYLQVAWNFAAGHGSTFNRVMPTNGYHPLWMLACAAVFKVFPDRVPAVHAIAGVIVLLDVMTMLTVRQILRLTGGDLWPVAFLLLLPFSFLSQLGTEGALSGFFLALLMLATYRLVLAPDGMKALLFGLAGALAVLSRLDNIFIVSIVWLAVAIRLWRGRRSILLSTIPVYGALWGPYLASNRIFFHTWQPISGMLKSNSRVDHAFGSNIPHIGLLAIVMIAGSALVLWVRTKSDLFLQAVEIPFAVGIACHGLYIVFRMSSETRWSWYYTSWILLASVMLARAVSVLLQGRRWLALPFAAGCLLVLVVSWVRVSYRGVYLGREKNPPASFDDVVYRQAGIHRAFAFDLPGRLAYHSEIEIIPLDGLMGDMKFQTDLAGMGIERWARENHVDGFIGPSVPMDQGRFTEMCSRIYLSTEQFHCPLLARRGEYGVSGVDIYSRVPAARAGTLPLNDRDIIWTTPGGGVSVWRLSKR